ncbi:MAG: DHHA1 domain-containing protein [Patescibacteria group bacterium]
MTKNVFLYHKNCDDGFGAAWAAWKRFGKKGTYIGSAPWEEPPSGLAGKNVYLMDLCYLPNHIKKLLKVTKSLTVIDHHISSREAIAFVSNGVFNNDFTHSGAVLSWKFFHPTKKVPLLLKVVEDVDIWKWKVPYSHELSASLRVYDRSFNTWSRLAREWESPKSRKKYIIEGGAIVKDHEDRVQEAVKDANLVNFCGYKTLASNSRMLVDYIGAALVKKFPPIGIIWSERGGKIVVSLRSNGKVDVSKLAVKFGGGGHKKSAAFRLEASTKLPWKIIKK